ncbi:MAG: AzlD domain-containing protein [Proteobacteria bacterium]|nr:AzlD domain-containing protein [Pseudomonadota bacterium]
METTYVWLIILTLAAATFATRLSFMGLLAHVQLPRLWQRALSYVPPAILAAIIAPQVFPVVQNLPTFDSPRLIAALVAFAVAFHTRSTLATVCVGMLVLWGLQAVGGVGAG